MFALLSLSLSLYFLSMLSGDAMADVWIFHNFNVLLLISGGVWADFWHLSLLKEICQLISHLHLSLKLLLLLTVYVMADFCTSLSFSKILLLLSGDIIATICASISSRPFRSICKRILYSLLKWVWYPVNAKYFKIR